MISKAVDGYYVFFAVEISALKSEPVIDYSTSSVLLIAYYLALLQLLDCRG